MKTRAYYLSENNEYIPLSIWDYIRYLKIDPKRWKNYEYYSTHKDIHKRKKMYPNGPRKCFCYYPSDSPQRNTGAKESLTHICCKKIISDLKKINFQFGESRIEFEFTGFSEEESIYFENGLKYIPDLIGTFTKPEYYAKKWNGKVVIEIAVSHESSLSKIFDYKQEEIAAIEVKISPKLIFSKNRDCTEQEKMEYTNMVKKTFQEKVFAKIVSDPSSKQFLIDENTSLRNENKILKEATFMLNKENAANKSKIKILEGENKDLQTKLSKITNRGFVEKFKDLFR